MNSVRPAQAGVSARAHHRTRRLQLESLEARLALTSAPLDYTQLLTHGGVCSCPICSGQGLETLRMPELATVVGQSEAGPAGATPVGVPQLSSLPGASATLYLDFDGHTEASWGGYSNVVTSPYDLDGNTSSYSSAEIAAMREIWTRVAEDFAPFNINVTTVDPGLIANGSAVRICIGGDWDDWFGYSAGGVAYVGGFYNGASNVGYVFEEALANGNPRYTAEAASHEAGHTFGLLHQAVWNGSTLDDEYNPGDSNWAPIMGVGYYAGRTTWHNGATSDGPSVMQDNMSFLANSSNGFGYRADDFGSTTAAASTLPVSGTSVNVAGLIGTNSDRDIFEFTTGGGSLSLNLNVAQFGANLDSVLEILNASGQVVATANPANSLGASLTTSLASGTYYASVRSTGGYGNVGQYTLSGTVPGGGGGGTAAAPEISLAVSGTNLTDGGTFSFGATTVGTAVTRTVTVTNSGGGTLNLTALATSLPAGYTLVSNVADTTLSAGQSTTFAIRLNAAAAGTFSGGIALTNTDSNESPFNLQLSGTVNSAPVGNTLVRVIDNGSTGFTTSGSWTRRTGVGRDADIHYTTKGTGTRVATWNFTGLEAGSYRVSVTWPKSTTYATNAPFTVYDGTRSMATVRVNQEASPSGFSYQSSTWRDLGTFTITGNQLMVKLTNSANDRVAADAIRIERVAPTGTLRPVFAKLAAPSDSAAPTVSTALGSFAQPLFAATSGLPEVLPIPTSPAESAADTTPASSGNIWQHQQSWSLSNHASPAQPASLALARVESLLDVLAADQAGTTHRSLLDDLLATA